MKIIVCIKQVPESTTEMDWKTGNIIRSQSRSILNPYDRYAIETALTLREKMGGHISAITMGPETASQILKEAISFGIDEGILISDRSFAGADVYATAYTLCQAIKKIGDFDMIICGQQSTDGDTAQLPSSLASMLDIPSFSWVRKVLEIDSSGVTVSATLSEKSAIYKSSYPVLLSVENESNVPRVATLKGKISAKTVKIKRFSLVDFDDSDPQNYGLSASPTKVLKIINQTFDLKSRPLVLEPDDAARFILKGLKEGFIKDDEI